jgi:light-regulated signal transduction histidine kinase (bacteriophytochrome)
MVSIASLSNEHDLLQGFILTALDMTERLRMREATQRLNSELTRRVAARTAELARTTSDLQMLSQSLAHDLRQPLISMGGFCGLLRNSVTTDKARHYTDRLSAGIHQINAKADALLYFANLSRLPLVRVDLDLVPIARTIGASLQARAPDRQVTLVLPSALHAQGDAALIQRLLTDLMSNAWAYTAQRSDAVVELGQRTDATSTVFYVKDNGAGFDMTFADSLFEPFQSMRVNDSDPGEGLGLARVKRIVMKHGGRVWAESQPDHGATFCFTLPADPHGENAIGAPASPIR